MIKMDKIEDLLNDNQIDFLVTTKFTSETPAHYCVKNGHIKILQRILGMNPEAAHAIDDEENTLLHSLCFVSVIL